MAAQSVRLFGMCVRSDIPLPGLDQESAADDPDVVIEIGEVPVPAAPVPELAGDRAGATLTIEGVARYRISGGSHIIVQPEASAPEANVRLFLLGSAMGVLLHQRGLLPLHASAVEIDGRAVAFVGRSGAGKSTLAAAFHDAAYRVIADDVCVIGFDSEQQAFVFPGIPRLRLWEESLTATGRTADSYELSYAGDESFRKFDVPIAPNASETPLAAMFLLGEGKKSELRPVSGSDAADSVFANTYRGEYLRLAGDPPAHYRAAIRLLQTVPLFKFSRPRDLGNLSDDVAQIAAFIRQDDPKAG